MYQIMYQNLQMYQTICAIISENIQKDVPKCDTIFGQKLD